MTVLRLRRSRWRIQSGLLALVATGCLLAGFGFPGSGGAGFAPLAAASDPAGPVLKWSKVTGAVHPPPLAYASAAYDSDDSTVVLFGGVEPTGSLSNDTWVWNGSSWIDFPGSQNQAAQAPQPRQLASMAFDPDLHQLILFGGEGAGGQILGDTWAWNGATWYPEPNVFSPPPREAAALAPDGSELVLFGGTGDARSGPASDSPPGSSTVRSTSTSAAGSTTAAPVPAVLGDTWLWNGSNWTASPATGPSARSGAAMSYDSAKHDIVLVGGETTLAGTTPPHLLADTWTWNGSAWKRAAPHLSPSGRDSAAMADDPDTGGVLLTTGEVGTQNTNSDIWLWTGTNWTGLQTQDGPSPRSGAAAAYDAASQQLVLFGGVSPGRTVLGDTYVLTSGPAGPAPAGSAQTSAGGATGPTTSAAPSAATGSTISSSQPSGARVSPAARRTPPGASTPVAQNPMVVHRSQKITLSTSGFKGFAPIQIWFESAPLLVARSTADRSGYFSATVIVPATATAGTHHFQAIGEAAAGGTKTWAVPVTVVKAGHPRATTRQTLIMVGVALLVPLAAWMILSGSDRTRARTRRRRQVEQLTQ